MVVLWRCVFDIELGVIMNYYFLDVPRRIMLIGSFTI